MWKSLAMFIGKNAQGPEICTETHDGKDLRHGTYINYSQCTIQLYDILCSTFNQENCE